MGPLFGGSLETTANLASLARELQEVEAEAFEVRPLVPAMLELYLDLHCHPESSGQEERTAARVDAALDRTGFAVTSGVGGHGVVGRLRNGEGPVVLLRAELDALLYGSAVGSSSTSRR